MIFQNEDVEDGQSQGENRSEHHQSPPAQGGCPTHADDAPEEERGCGRWRAGREVHGSTGLMY